MLDAEHALEPGEVAWNAAGRITSLRRCADRDAADVCVLPGLVDAHSHLQIAELTPAPRAFVPWLAAVMAARSSDTPAIERRRTRHHALSLLREGVTAVGDIDATGRAWDAIATTPLGGRVYRELTGFHLDRAASARLVRERAARGTTSLRTGLSPHAPYSVSAELFAAARASGRHLAIHCAETAEEQQFLHSGRGPFADLLASLGRLPAGHRPPRTGAVRWLERLGLLSSKTSLVHCQELERGDAERIAAAGATIVVCPGTIEWFRRAPPPVPRWLAAGIPVALGTDSRASSRELSLRAELRTAARLWPSLRNEQLLAMATTAGGIALGMRGLGRLCRGGRADFVVLRAKDRRSAIDDFVRGRGEPLAVHAAGQRVVASALRR